MEKQIPIREGSILTKQIHDPRSGTRNVSQTINQTVNNIIGATISGEPGYITVYDTATSLRTSSFLYEDATGVGLNTISPTEDFHVVGRGLFSYNGLDERAAVTGVVESVGYGVWGQDRTLTGYYGVYGTTNVGTAVRGISSQSGKGVWGESSTGNGVEGWSDGGEAGVRGLSVGTARGLYITTSSGSGTNPAAEVVQDAGTGARTALRVRNDSNDDAASGIFAQSTGGICIFGEAPIREAGYFFRPSGSTAATQPVCTIWTQEPIDGNDGLYVRHDGTGNVVAFNRGGANAVEVTGDGNLNVIGGMQTPPAAAVTAATHTISTGDPTCLLVSPPVGGTVVTLPAVTPAGQWVIVKDVSGLASGRNITINRAGSANIDAGTSVKISTNYGRIWLISNGTNWYRII